ncbi:MAG: nicotinate-nucleotide--dimethylbenzimidazole phosphoribosyltransferase [Mangrovicoccus sp.]|nr:nicotinate-nucleotide--dimethylbenzimidazole phosphoribosyltransferase [Mangrovicoccus sp.]
MTTDSFADLSALRAVLADLSQADPAARQAAKARDAVLTKPAGALGRLEELAAWYAGWRGQAAPRICAPQVIIFAGNHGVAAQGVSAFPPEVTVQMVGNFQAGGAAINQLAGEAGAAFSVHPMDLDRPTGDFTQGHAMSEAELCAAFATGWNAVQAQSDLLVTGEMGIGNTTSAAALAALLLGGAASDWTGRGTGVDDQGLDRKTQVVARAVALHGDGAVDGIDALARVGGRELAGMAGAIARARVLRIPVILDGFICCAAALALEKTAPGALDHTVAGHVSAEAAHGKLLAALGKEPLLSLGLRLGEGSGATLAIPIVKAALACHSGMATFADAGVADGGAA